MSEQPSKRSALLVGINSYQAPDIPALSGCEADVYAFAALLEGQFGFNPTAITCLVGAQATRLNILTNLARLAQEAQAGDYILFHFSGHGSRTPDREPYDEPDGWDESLVPFDGRDPDDLIQDITDDEMRAWLTHIKPDVLVWLIFDCCHSGHLTRAEAEAKPHLPTAIRAAPPDRRRPVPPPTGNARFRRLLLPPVDEPTYVAFAACDPRQPARELQIAPANGAEPAVVHGALTYALLCALTSATLTSTFTFSDLAEQVRKRLAAHAPEQKPQFEGHLDWSVLGQGPVEQRSFIPVLAWDNDHITLAGGAPLGLTQGVEVAVYPAGEKMFNDAQRRLASARVDVVGVAQATARLIAPINGTPDPTARAIVCALPQAETPLLVQVVETGANQAAVEAIRTALTPPGLLRLATPDETPHVIVAVGNQAVEVCECAGNRSLITYPLTAGWPQALAKRLQQMARYAFVARLQTPRSAALHQAIAVTPVQYNPTRTGLVPDANGVYHVQQKQPVSFQVINQTWRPLYLTILKLAPDDQVRQGYPPAGQAKPQAAGVQTTLSYYKLTPGEGAGRYLYKVIASSAYVDFMPLEVGGARAGSTHDLQAWVDGLAANGVRHLSPEQTEEEAWEVVTVAVEAM